jgi:predicted metal-dependent phosphoesterase TrpH
MIKCFRADLHVHTCLSPCADLTMSPKRIVEKCISKDIDIVAICDHNSAENTGATIKKAYGTSVVVIPGMEICTVEEVHIIALLPTCEAARVLQEMVYAKLSPGKNDERLFGQQIIVNEFDEIEGYNNRLLIAATSLSVSEIVDEIHRLGGLAIASHVDRENYSIISQLGFIPEDLQLDGVELSIATSVTEALEKFPQIKPYPLVCSSDAHYLDEIGRITTQFMIEEPNMEELKEALKGANGRSIAV